MSLLPIIFAIVSGFIVVLSILNSIMKEKLLKVSFVITLINTLSFFVYYLLFKINLELFNYIFIAHGSLTVIAFIVYGYLFISLILFKQNYVNKLTVSLKEIRNSFYFIVNKKEKVIAISDNFLTELGLQKEEVINKNIFNVFNQAIRITHFDQVETNNNSLKVFYEEYKKSVTKDDLNRREIVFQNYKGISVHLTIIEQPIYYFNKYKGRINIGKIEGDLERLGVEGELSQALNDYESLRLKYIQTLKLASDGFYYIDLDNKTIWLSEVSLKMLGLKNEMLLIEDFYKYIHKEDLPSLLGSLSSLTKRKVSFKTRYRFLKGNHYLWLEDEGIRIFEDNHQNIIMGKFKLSEAKNYSYLGLEDIDGLKTEKEIFAHLESLFNNGKTFELALFELSNIPDINKKYGRDVSNMLMNEYVKKLKGSFLSESSEIFRISGLVFAVTIIDPRKMELLRSGLLKDPEFLNLEMNYGAVNLKMEVFLGVASSYKDAKEAKEIFEFSNKALSVARHKDFKLNVCYYGDLNE